MRRKGGIFGGVGSSGVGPVIADDGGSWAKGLEGEGVEKAGQEWGAVARSDKGDDAGGIDHGNKMADEMAGGEKGVRQKRGLAEKKQGGKFRHEFGGSATCRERDDR